MLTNRERERERDREREPEKPYDNNHHAHIDTQDKKESKSHYNVPNSKHHHSIMHLAP